MKTYEAREFEHSSIATSAHDDGSTGAAVTIIGCLVILLVMAWA